MKPYQQSSQLGMTLIEILIALGILSVLAAVALPSYTEHKKRVMISQAKADITEISQRLEKYRAFNYAYPEYLSDMGSVPKDPWGNSYAYLNLDDVDPNSGKIKTGGKGPKPQARKKKNLKPLNTDYDLFSVGPNGEYSPNVSAKDSIDDVIRADDGAYIGMAGEY